MPRTDLRPTRRSVLLAFLSPLRSSQPQPRQLQAARMTPVADAWTRFFLWTGFTAGSGLPAAA